MNLMGKVKRLMHALQEGIKVTKAEQEAIRRQADASKDNQGILPTNGSN